MKKILCILISIITILSLTVLCFAHSGRTDSSGGHRDSSTGEYHYHHGYPAHQHPNGKCPYDFDDKTNHNNANNNNSPSETKSTEDYLGAIVLSLVGSCCLFLPFSGFVINFFEFIFKTSFSDKGFTIIYIITFIITAVVIFFLFSF